MAVGSKSIGQKRVVLDCSVALSWCFPDEKSTSGQKLLQALADKTVIVPSLWFLEVSNAMIVGERRGRLSRGEVAEALQLLSRLPLEVDDRAGFPLATDLLTISRAHGLSAYDAAYLELALRRSAKLATLDRRLQIAAKAVGVTVHAAV
jgi:predicted nucleic acid-binding protein